MNRKLIFLSFIIMFLINSCMSYRAIYDIKLAGVERPADAKERYGSQKITSFEEEGQTKYSFEDELVKINWLPTSYEFVFNLTNKTEHSIKIVWDEAVYVNSEGISKRVMHEGVKYIDRNNSQPPTTVVRGATISDIIFPTNKAYYVSSPSWSESVGWKRAPLFPLSGTTSSEVTSKASSYKGEEIQIMLPIKIEDVVNEYIFIFNIEDFTVTQ